jgi:hypothetical protein
MRLQKKTLRGARDDAVEIVHDLDMSGCFGRSKRQLRLFQHILEKSLSGSISEVTQYSIAIDILDRPETFDPGTDSIVRVEMHRLRSSIEAYNMSNSRFFISIPPAGFQVNVRPRYKSPLMNGLKQPLWTLFVAFFALGSFFIGKMTNGLNADVEPVLQSQVCSETLPNLAVNNTGASSEAQIYVDSILRSVMTQQTSFNLIRQSLSCYGNSAPLFNVNYSLIHLEEQMSLAISIEKDQSEEIVGSYHLSGPIADIRPGNSLYYEIVKTANAIVMPDGTVARMAPRYQWTLDSYRQNYRCLSLMYDSFSGGTDAEIKYVHDCLQKSVDGGAAPLDNYGALASNHFEQARTSPSSFKKKAFQSGEAIIHTMGDDWMNSVEISMARIYYEAQREDFSADRFNSILIAIETMYNTNPQVLMTASSFYGYSLGDWQKAKKISDKIKRIYSVDDQSIHEIDAGYALMSSDNENLMQQCSKFYSEKSAYSNVIVNACARKTKDNYWYGLTEANLNRLKLFTVEDKMSVFETVRHDPVFLGKIRSILSAENSI